MSKDLVTLKLTVTVTYDANGVEPKWLADRLKKQLETLLYDESVSLETPADVIDTSIWVTEV